MTANGSARGNLTSAGKVLELLLLFSAERPELSVPQMSELIAATVPTTYRYLALLKKLELLVEGSPGRYHPTARVIPLARAAQIGDPLPKIAAPLLREAVDHIGETVMLLQRLGDVLICTELVESPHSMRYTIPKGRTIPLGVGASGKLGLALADHETKARLRPTSLTERQLDDINAQGFAISGSEIDRGSWACSVPIPIPHDGISVLSCAGPETRMTVERQGTTLETLKATAARIGLEFARLIV